MRAVETDVTTVGVGKVTGAVNYSRAPIRLTTVCVLTPVMRIGRRHSNFVEYAVVDENHPHDFS
jgi:hypothetical protein